MNSYDSGRSPLSVWVWLGLIMAAGLALRLGLAPSLRLPMPADGIYYHHVARNIYSGRGMVIDYAWIYARGVPQRLPMPACGYWMPGAAVVQLPAFYLTGPSLLSAQLTNIALGLMLVLLTFFLGRWLWRSDFIALLAAALAALLGEAVLMSIVPDTYMLDAILVAGTLVCWYWGVTRHGAYFLLGGLLLGLAYLTRSDAVLSLVALPIYLALAWRRKFWQTPRWWPATALVVFAIVIAPWLVRNTVVFGSPTPPILGKLMILPTYWDIFRADLDSITVAEWLQQKHGLGGALVYRTVTVLRVIQWLLGVFGLAAPFALLGLWKDRRQEALPFWILGLLLCAGYPLLLPELCLKGSLQRSAPALFPILCVAAAAGLVYGAEWLAARRHSPSPCGIATVLAILLLLSTAGLAVHSIPKRCTYVDYDPYYLNRERVAAFFARNARPGETVLTDDPWKLHEVTGLRALQTPSDGVEALHTLAKRFDCRYLVVMGLHVAKIPGLAAELSDPRKMLLLRRYSTRARHGGLHIFDLRGGGPDAVASVKENTKGVALVSRNRPAEALPHFEAALALAHSHGEEQILLNLATTHLRLKQIAPARRYLERLLTLDPPNMPAHLHYARLLARLGDTAGARRHYEAIQKCDPEAARLWHVSQELRQLGRAGPGQTAPRP